MNIITQLGYAAIGTRFRILTDRLMLDADKVYKSLKLDFEPRWFTVFFLINQKSPLTITELAEKLGYSQPAVTQIVNILTKKKLVKAVKEKLDTRKKQISITPKGEELILKLIPVWQDIENATREFFASTGYDILFILNKLETELDSKDIYTRVMEKIKMRQFSEVKIIEYKPALKQYFYDLNKEWLTKYFEIEGKDRIQLENPEKEIIKKGGFIFFAEYENKITGTAALIKHENEYEIAKMAVSEEFQGRQIGKKLAFAAIEKAKELKCSSVYLETSIKLTSAVNLYKSLGFQEVENFNQTDYKRSTIKMVLDLNYFNTFHKPELTESIQNG